MAIKQQPLTPESKELSIEDIKFGIKKLQRRINDLTELDTTTIVERFDSKINALEKKINGTIADIFGRRTPEYNDYKINSC